MGPRWGIARDGWPFVYFVLVPTLACAGLGATLDSSVAWVLAAVGAVATGALLFFFRDPERDGPRGSELVVAPGDGKVLRVDCVTESSFFDGPARRISIFLSLFNVHVNRYPVSGTVEHKVREGGGFEPAWRSGASRRNARVSVGIRTAAGSRVLVRQITGLVARRIVNHSVPGAAVRQGERMGIIRFGSRIDLFLPPESVVLVRPGDRAVGGKTVLARLEGGA